MSVVFVLIPLSIVIAAGFLTAFIWAVRSGQYEDTCTPAMRVLLDERRGRMAPDAVPAEGAERSGDQQRIMDGAVRLDHGTPSPGFAGGGEKTSSSRRDGNPNETSRACLKKQTKNER